MERLEELKERIRQQSLNDRLEESRRRIGDMCSKGRCPKMTIPVQHDDDDFYINTTLADAQATIAALQARVQELEEWRRIVTGAGTDQESVIRLAAHEYTKTAIQCWKEANAKLESQLTQRTAELEAARRALLRHGYREFCDTAACNCGNQWNHGGHARERLQEISDVLPYENGKTIVQRAEGLVAELERVRGLVKALPKVEGDVTVRDITALYWASDGTYWSIDCKEQLVSLLKHRQGMEG